ncbi:VWA domain-containing protein [Ureibacillus thermosphaericus]|uniref:VWA domain-containing protein n=1 Tax=Ureibacillus thermosphaericus TaxID=51173 RepID=UPI000BBCC39B|nr:VWA domain-containing protein [Ureibacillus thermosphaericus]
MDLRIDHPIFLLLLIPLLGYLIWTWLHHRSLLKRKHGIVFIIRIITIIMLVFAIASPYLLLPVKEEQVLFLIDRSASMAGTEDEALKFIEESLREKKETHSVGIYSFALNFQTEAILSKTLEHVPNLSEIREVGETNIEQALQLATGIVDKDKATRIVLMTDGLQTKGEVLESITKIAGSKISVDVVPLGRKISNDVSIQSFTTPQVAYQGEEQTLVTEIESTTDTMGELLLYENDQLIFRETIQLEEGKNVFTYRHKGNKEGLVKYEAYIQTDEDAILENNKLTSITMVQSTPRLLIVSDREEGSPIADMLNPSSIQFEEVLSEELPSSLSYMLKYDAIIFDNVPGHLVGEAKMGVIEQAVKNFGIGFMMVGGENSFGLGGYFKTPIEKLLPVEMEVKGKQQLPSLGLVIVLDRSGSMIGLKMELAKEAAVRSVELLREGDTFGLIAFDSHPWEIIETKPLGNKDEVTNTILSIPAEGGTEIYPSLSLAYNNLFDLPLQRKHIILLTDGQSATSGNYEELIESGKKKHITLSTVAIGHDADRQLLESLSELAGGRFYDVEDETTIPSILSRETAMISRTYIVDDPFYPVIYHSDGWNQLFEEGVPQMNAYIGTTAKTTANVIAESEKEDPVLAEWQYGLGRTIAFTSDSTGAWAGDWGRWDRWVDFWNTAISRLLPTYNEIAYDIRMDGEGSFLITDPTNQAAFLDVAVVDEYGNELEVHLEPISASKVRAVADAKPGLVFFRISKDDNVYQAGLTVPYSSEYRLQQLNEKLLEEVADKTGGKIVEDPQEVFRKFNEQGATRQSIATIILLVSLLLFFVDITIRRFGWAFFKQMGKSKNIVTAQKVTEEETSVAEILKELRKK